MTPAKAMLRFIECGRRHVPRLRPRRPAVTAAVAAALTLPLLAAIGLAPARASSTPAAPGGTGTAAGSTALGSAAVVARVLAAAASRARLPATAVAIADRLGGALAGRSGSITGTVLGADGLPLAGACVTAIGASRSVTTGTTPEGRFDITGLAAGSYALEYRDCAAQGHYLTRWSGGTAWQRTAAQVRVGVYRVSHVPAMTLRPLNPAAMLPDPGAWRRLVSDAARPLSAAAAARTGSISGVVTGDGKRLRGICVEALSAAVGGPGYGATTRKNGTYAFHGVRPGSYFVVFERFEVCPDKANWLQQVYRHHNSPFFQSANKIKVTSGRTTRGISASLVKGGEISGTVTNRSGSGLSGICVFASGQYAHTGIGFGSATGRGGHYVLQALFPGEYFLSFAAGCRSTANYAPASAAPVRINHTQHRIVNIKLPAGGILTGVVRSGSGSGPLLGGICVTASNNSGSIMASTSTAANGRYTLDGLTTGRYAISFTPGCNNNGNYLSSTIYAHATQGRTTSANAILQLGAEIIGRVTNSSGAALGGMCVELAGPASASPYISPQTAPDGSYLVDQMTAGSYGLGFTSGCGNSANYAPYYYDDQADPSLATPIDVAVGSVHIINAQMQIGGEISGRITGERGKKLSGICVGVTPAYLAGLPGFFYDLVFSHDGQFDMPALEPGQYYVDLGCDAPAGYAGQWFPDSATSAGADLVSVAPGQTSGISAVLQQAGSISGVVTGKSGRPLSGICVEVYDAKNGAPAGASLLPPMTGRGGGYDISGLPAGRYQVEFFPCTANLSYVTLWYRGQAGETSATAVKVRAGATTSGVDARLTIGGSISGRVTGADGKSLDNICVLALNEAKGLFDATDTGVAGTYQMLGVSTASYTVEFTPCNGQNLITTVGYTRVVAPRATTGVNITMRRGGSVSGVITTAEPGAVPVANECVDVDSANPNNVGGVAISGSGGRYLATGIAPGTYTVYLGDQTCGEGPPNLTGQWYDNQQSAALATKITVKVGHTTTGIDAALETTGEITGSVRGPSGAPVSGICVTAHGTAAGSVPVVAVSRAGGYSLTDLQPEPYVVEFSAGCGATGYRTQWWHDARSASTATVIAVSATQLITGVSATLRR
jgi:hypothetical protein